MVFELSGDFGEIPGEVWACCWNKVAASAFTEPCCLEPSSGDKVRSGFAGKSTGGLGLVVRGLLATEGGLLATPWGLLAMGGGLLATAGGLLATAGGLPGA